MYEKIRKYIEQYHMLEGMENVVAGLSGGADSVCLLFMLRKYISENAPGIRITAVHVHHGLRGAEADRDAAFCQRLCERLCVEYRQFDYDVSRIAAEKHMSEEEAGRQLRYESFFRVLEEKGGDAPGRRGVIAVAHHRKDQAETVLLNLVRGSGIKGARGMLPVHGGIIRPLLCVKREEIEAYLKRIGEEYCTDGTNAGDVYARNRIRHRVLPYLAKNINAGAEDNLCAFAGRMAELDSYMEGQLDEAYGKYVKEDGAAGGFFLSEGVLLEHPVIQKGLCRRLLERLCGGRDLEEKHVQELLKLFSRQCGRRVDLPKGITAKKSYGGINLFFAENTIGDDGKAEEILPEYSVTVDKIDILYDNNSKIDKKNLTAHYTKYFDYGKIRNYIAALGEDTQITLRHRRPGDHIVIDREGHRKKVKELLIENRVPAGDREGLWLFALESNVLWIVGVRGSADFWIDESTTELLRLSVAPENGQNTEDDQNARENKGSAF